MDKISVDTFNLIARSLQREHLKTPEKFVVNCSKVIYCDNGLNIVSVFVHDGYANIILGTGQVCKKCDRPNVFFNINKKNRKLYNESIAIINEIVGDERMDDMEKTICGLIPSAKDIIAEKALVEDGN